MTLNWGLTEWKSILIAEAVVGEEGRHMDNEEGRREGADCYHNDQCPIVKWPERRALAATFASFIYYCQNTLLEICSCISDNLVIVIPTEEFEGKLL